MSREKFLLQVQKGALVPYDEHTQARLREKGYRIGNILSAELTKPRNPGYHRLAHAFGRLLADNLDEFRDLPAHSVLKRLQIEANIACDEMPLNFPGIGPCVYRVPQSLSYASMDQGTFEETIWAMYRYVADRYWPGLEADQIQEMVDMMEAA